MAKNLNLNVTVDIKQANLALNGFIASLKKVDSELKAMKGGVSTVDTSLDKLDTTGKKTTKTTKDVADGLNKVGKESKNASQEVNSLDEKTRKATKTLQDMPSIATKMGNSFTKAFSGIGREILATTKLLTTFATVTGGALAYKAKNDYINYSNQYTQFSGITKPKTAEENKAMKDMISSVSIAVGKDQAKMIEDMKNAASGGIPITRDVSIKNKKAQDLDYLEQIKNFGEAQKKIGKMALVQGATPQEANNAIIMYGQGKGYTQKQMLDPKIIDHIIGIISNSLDQGLGSLGEYNTGFSKFLKEGLDQKGATEEMVMANFIRQTKLKSPALAAFTAGSFFRSIGSEEITANAAAVKIQNLLKDKKDSQGNKVPFWAGNAEQTAQRVKFLNEVGSAKFLKSNLFETAVTKNGKTTYERAGQEQVIDNYMKLMKKAESQGMEAGSFLQLIEKNANTRKQLLDLYKGGWADVKEIVGSFGTEESRSQNVADKNKTLESGFGYNYSVAMSSYTDMVNKAGDLVNPSLSTTATILKDMFSGNKSDMSAFNKVFEDNYKQLEQSNPLLAKMVKYLQEFGNYAGSGELTKDFQALLNLIDSITTALSTAKSVMMALWNSPVVAGIRGLSHSLGGGAGTDALIAIGGYAALKATFAGLGGAIATGMSAEIATLGIGATLGGLIWGGFVSAALGSAFGAFLFKKFGAEPNKKEGERIDKISSNAKDILKSGKMNTGQNIKYLQSMDEPILFDTLTPNQRNLIANNTTDRDFNGKSQLELGLRGMTKKQYSLNDLNKELGIQTTNQLLGYATKYDGSVKAWMGSLIGQTSSVNDTKEAEALILLNKINEDTAVKDGIGTTNQLLMQIRDKETSAMSIGVNTPSYPAVSSSGTPNKGMSIWTGYGK